MTSPKRNLDMSFERAGASAHESEGGEGACVHAAVDESPPLNLHALPRYINLNVGGVLFTTARTTLCNQGHHMLSAMFSGRNPIVTDEDGYTVIDRDGRCFHYVLNFLRDGEHAVLPGNDHDLHLLLAESRYYALDKLSEMIEVKLGAHGEHIFQPQCSIPYILSTIEEESVVKVSESGLPVVKLVFNRYNNRFSYTPPSDDALLKNIELFDKISVRFRGRILYCKDVRGRGGHICSWFFYGHGRLLAEVSCSSMVYSSDKRLTKIEFPEARLYEENMNLLLYEPGAPNRPELHQPRVHGLPSPPAQDQ